VQWLGIEQTPGNHDVSAVVHHTGMDHVDSKMKMKMMWDNLKDMQTNHS